MNPDTTRLLDAARTSAASLHEAARAGFEGFELVSVLNLAAARAVMADTAWYLLDVAAAREAGELYALQSGYAEALRVKTQAYGHAMAGVAADLVEKLGQTGRGQAFA
ncbi:hypothetical protein RA210_U70096 [Rubrivivax sp. A210]|uniref:TIGR01841 family phasin n=1 Tax=Rubrivivax sp. A210 TaxID=2772301 RepID=UPI00191B73C3|nr:TIGR01841 family phasin [Rubrivivax sp. A210]CAD5374780.1 hypothetical protein RA210_U70096 [Rubrivivax sp. A210]